MDKIVLAWMMLFILCVCAKALADEAEDYNMVIEICDALERTECTHGRNLDGSININTPIPSLQLDFCTVSKGIGFNLNTVNDEVCND